MYFLYGFTNLKGDGFFRPRNINFRWEELSLKEEQIMQYVEDRIPVNGNEEIIMRQCRRACSKVNGMVKDGENPPESLMEETAAVLTVLYYLQYALAGGVEQVTHFKAGDVSVTQSAGDIAAMQKEMLGEYRACLTNLSPYLSETASSQEGTPFFFRGVGGCRFQS